MLNFGRALLCGMTWWRVEEGSLFCERAIVRTGGQRSWGDLRRESSRRRRGCVSKAAGLGAALILSMFW